LRLLAPPTLPARRIHFPAVRSLCGSHRSVPAPPRRQVPPWLRSASAVSHDLDGLLLSGPGDLFQPLTPMGFGLPLPRLVVSGRPGLSALPPGIGGWVRLRAAPGWPVSRPASAARLHVVPKYYVRARRSWPGVSPSAAPITEVTVPAPAPPDVCRTEARVRQAVRSPRPFERGAHSAGVASLASSPTPEFGVPCSVAASHRETSPPPKRWFRLRSRSGPLSRVWPFAAAGSACLRPSAATRGSLRLADHPLPAPRTRIHL
jgi:hypothetical protein